jgi:hypothetical protein
VLELGTDFLHCSTSLLLLLHPHPHSLPLCVQLLSVEPCQLRRRLSVTFSGEDAYGSGVLKV